MCIFLFFVLIRLFCWKWVKICDMVFMVRLRQLLILLCDMVRWNCWVEKLWVWKCVDRLIRKVVMCLLVVFFDSSSIICWLLWIFWFIRCISWWCSCGSCLDSLFRCLKGILQIEVVFRVWVDIGQVLVFILDRLISLLGRWKLVICFLLVLVMLKVFRVLECMVKIELKGLFWWNRNLFFFRG